MSVEQTVIQGASHHVQNSRIAKNATLLFIRMTLLMMVNLYTVRVLLDRLGDENYGVFNAVAGIVSSLTCMTSVLAVSTQRFYSYAQGKGLHDKVKEIFSASININVLLSLCVVLLFESAGLWFLNNYMQISPDATDAANAVFHYAVLTFVCAIIQIPFTAMIIANEQMGWFALLSSLECVSKLTVALLIGCCPVTGLVFYSSGLLIVGAAILCIYISLALIRFKECQYVKVKSKETYRQLLKFSGWTLFGALANVGLMQGSMILLNIFFGVLANSAFAVSQQVYNAFNSLVSSVVVAIRPSMIRLYASNDKKKLFALFNSSNKFICLLCLGVGIPLYAEMDYVLEIWLHSTNPLTTVYARMMILYAFIVAMSNPITIMMQAAGTIDKYHLKVESVTLLSMPITGWLFCLGYPSTSLFVVIWSLMITAHGVRLVCLHSKFATYSIAFYMKHIILPALAILAVTALSMWIVQCFMESSLLRLFITMLLSTILLLSAYMLVGFSKAERQWLKEFIRKKIRII